MSKIFILTDYRGYFLSKNKTTPLGSGMSHKLLIKYFYHNGFDVEFITLAEAANNLERFRNHIVVYTSSEDQGGYYKSFVNDVLLAIQLNDGKLIPKYEYLYAHNNKVFQELLRYGTLSKIAPKSHIFGSVEDISKSKLTINYPVVFKLADGAMSKNVHLANNEKELYKLIKKHTNVDSLKTKFRNFLRKWRYKHFNPITSFRRKFILQEFISNLKNDWKVLIFGNRYYIFERPVRSNDFRASGSGHDLYKYGEKANIPEGILDFAMHIKELLDTPSLSVDICYDGNKFYMIEYQFLHFGTVGQVRSNNYYVCDRDKWKIIYEKLDLEKVYADAISNYIHEYKLL